MGNIKYDIDNDAAEKRFDALSQHQQTEYRGNILLKQYFDFTFELEDKIYAFKRVEVVYGSKKFTIGLSKLRVQIGV